MPDLVALLGLSIRAGGTANQVLHFGTARNVLVRAEPGRVVRLVRPDVERADVLPPLEPRQVVELADDLDGAGLTGGDIIDLQVPHTPAAKRSREQTDRVDHVR